MKKSKFFLRVGKSLLKNIELKIVALLFACLLWFIIVNISDPVTPTTFSNIPVTLSNMDIITNQGKTLQMLYGSETVNVTIHATRSAREAISSDNIVATADISQMELNTLVPITVTVPGFDEMIVSAVANPSNLQVLIEDIERRTFPVIANVTGRPAEGYVVGETTATPETITITGAETLVDSIGRVEVRANVVGLFYSQSLPGELVIIDDYGDRMNMALFPGVVEEAAHYVNVEILETKSVPIRFGAIENIPEGYIVTNISSEPNYILVAGTEEELQGLREVTVISDAFELDEEVGIHEITVDIRPHLPEGIILADENANLIVVNLAIERAGTRTIEVPVDSISIENLLGGLVATFDTNGTISIVVSGQQRILDGLDLRNYVSVDLIAFNSPGIISVPVQIELQPNVTLLRGVTVRIILEEAEVEEGENLD
jgi:YbbR domain-containing protein